MRDEASGIVRAAASDTALVENRTADMRYRGQGHEITIVLPDGPYNHQIGIDMIDRFETSYETTFSRRIPNLDVEVLNWSLRLSAAVPDPELCPPNPPATEPAPGGSRMLFDPETAAPVEVSVYNRDRLKPGNLIVGPAIIAEDETTTIVLSGYEATVNAQSHIVLRRAR